MPWTGTSTFSLAPTNQKKTKVKREITQVAPPVAPASGMGEEPPPPPWGSRGDEAEGSYR